MNESMEGLVLEQLRAIRADIAEFRESSSRIETRLTGIEHHMAELITSFGGHPGFVKSEVALQGRFRIRPL